MDLMGLCSLCGKPGKMFTCCICGKIVCASCFDSMNSVCNHCKTGKIV
jgi:hypothetical protein